jgi:hypothetical protein
MKPEDLNLKQAAEELNIDVPIMAIRALKDGGFELTLYGGRVVKYSPKKKAQQPAPSPEPAIATCSEPGAIPSAGDAGEPEPEPAQQPEPQPQPSQAAQPPAPEPDKAAQPPAPAGSPKLESLTVAQLRKLAGQIGIANASRLTKAQLIQSLSGLYSELDEISRKKDI